MAERDYFRHEYERGYRPSFWATARGTKALVLGLAGLHVLLALLARIAPETHLAIWRALYLSPDDVVREGRVWQLVTAAFLHVDMMHLLFNCLSLFFFGRIVEDRLGTRRFFLFSLGAAVAASLGYVGWSLLEQGTYPMVGASGAVMGVLVLCAFWYPNLPVYFWGIFEMPLWVVAAIVVAIDLLMAISNSVGVAHTAHLAGAAFGWAYFRYGSWVERIFTAIDRGAEERRRRREFKDREDDAGLRGELDRILDKVNREGMGALSEAELRSLKRASKRLRR
ncbi:MAG: rhomboid family intramembrane serine protease [Planctomycetota bacterium]